MDRASRYPLSLLLLVAFAFALFGASLGSEDVTPKPVASADAERLAKECHAVSGDGEPPSSAALRNAFVDPGGSEPVRLLLDKSLVRPGESLTMAPLNLTSSSISYGLHAGVEEASTGEPLPGPGGGLVLLLGISAAPGQVGACTSVAIPNSAPPGQYLAVLFGVDGDQISKSDVKAPFEISGQPLVEVARMRAGVIPAQGVGRTYPKRVIREAENRVARVLRQDELAGGYAVGDHLTNRSIFVEVPELSRAAYREIVRVSRVPVRFTIESGPRRVHRHSDASG